MLIDIMSPQQSEQASRIIKLREKVKKMNEAKHLSSYYHLMKGFQI